MCESLALLSRSRACVPKMLVFGSPQQMHARVCERVIWADTNAAALYLLCIELLGSTV